MIVWLEAMNGRMLKYDFEQCSEWKHCCDELRELKGLQYINPANGRKAYLQTGLIVAIHEYQPQDDEVKEVKKTKK